MTSPSGARPPSIAELVRAQDRISFLYFEHVNISRDASAVTATGPEGTIHVPAAAVGTVLLGPGTTITHQAITLLAESGATAVWVGEQGVRYYAHGRSLANPTRLLEAQARLVTNQRSRLAVAREMYAIRFPGEDVSCLSMQQLRGREGARVRRAYREASTRWSVRWSGRDYAVDDFGAADSVNQALSSATACLYGVAHSVIVALGCSPGLGFIHTGHERSFVYDIADLYKAELAIPVAFEAASEDLVDISGHTRRLMRNAIFEARLVERCVKDIKGMLLPSDDLGSSEGQTITKLWDTSGEVSGGVSYRESHENEVPW